MFVNVTGLKCCFETGSLGGYYCGCKINDIQALVCLCVLNLRAKLCLESGGKSCAACGVSFAVPHLLFMGEWVVGAFINLFGSLAINFGTNLLKLGHNEV